MCRYDYQEGLIKQGYYLVGDGRSATVYSKNDIDYVIKVFCAWDKGYLAFLRIINRNKDNPYLPKVFEFKKHIDKENKDCYYSVKIEKLKKGEFDSYNGNTKLMQNSLDTDKVDYLNDELYEFVENNKYSRNPLYKVVKEIVKADNFKNVGLDCHNENIMIREVNGKPELVFTDPLTFRAY